MSSPSLSTDFGAIRQLSSLFFTNIMVGGENDLFGYDCVAVIDKVRVVEESKSWSVGVGCVNIVLKI